MYELKVIDNKKIYEKKHQKLTFNISVLIKGTMRSRP